MIMRIKKSLRRLRRRSAPHVGDLCPRQFASVRATIGPGEAMVAGPDSIEVTANGRILVKAGEAVFIIRPDDADTLSVQCLTDGPHLPAKRRMQPRGQHPLCRMGPGGDFTRGYTPEAKSKTSELSREARHAAIG